MQTQIPGSESEATGSAAFEICREAADNYMNSGKPLYITAKDICSSMAVSTSMARLQIETYDPNYRETGPFLIDLRKPDSEMRELYYYGHIPGAINVSWRAISKFKTLSSLPMDRQIVVYSNNGQTGGQVAAILGMMGYDAVNLKWGMTSWTKDSIIAPDRFEPSKDILWQNSAYRSIVSASFEPDVRYPLPDFITDAQTPSAIIWAAADEYLKEYRPANISASSLYDPMFQMVPPIYASPYDDDPDCLLVLPFGVEPDAHDEPFVWPFVLDVRHADEFAVGHIPGSLNIPARDVFKKEFLNKLPPDRQIVVCSRTGHTSAHVVALLNILGYESVNLKWGMSGWAPKGDNNPVDPYYCDHHANDYPVIKGWLPGRPVECKS